MWSKQNIDNVKSSNQERFNKVSPRAAKQNPYENYKNRIENSQRDQDNRKHNSPDMNRYRSNLQNKSSYAAMNRKYKGSPENDEKQVIRYNKKQREDNGQENNRDYMLQKNKYKQNGKGKEHNRNSSSPNFTLEEKRQEEQNQQYMKLHEKLNFIQSKIADMKKHVQKKKQEKQQIIQAKKRRQREKEEERRKKEQTSSKKMDLKQFVTQVAEHSELHTFTNNPYSPNHSIYYVSEIIKSYKDQKSIGREHLLTSLHILKILEHSKFATEEEMKQRQVKLPYRAGYEGKKSVIFDLDETLIHCNDTLTPPYDVKLPITFPTGEVIQAGINIRPYAHEILRNLSQHFQIIVFTASHSCYANVVLDYFDPEHEYIHHRLFREHCYQTPEGMYCKDLRVLDRNMKDMVLVDNAAYSYAAQLDNGIPILPYYHGKSDYELRALEHFLLKMLVLPDIRTLCRETFQLHEYRNYYHDSERLVQELYMSQEEAQ